MIDIHLLVCYHNLNSKTVDKEVKPSASVQRAIVGANRAAIGLANGPLRVRRIMPQRVLTLQSGSVLALRERAIFRQSRWYRRLYILSLDYFSNPRTFCLERIL